MFFVSTQYLEKVPLNLILNRFRSVRVPFMTPCFCVSKGAKCNMAVFNANKQPSDDNCFLFHCQTEQDCPLMKAQEGINTYDIYKGDIFSRVIPGGLKVPFSSSILLAPTFDFAAHFLHVSVSVISSNKLTEATSTLTRFHFKTNNSCYVYAERPQYPLKRRLLETIPISV